MLCMFSGEGEQETSSNLKNLARLGLMTHRLMKYDDDLTRRPVLDPAKSQRLSDLVAESLDAGTRGENRRRSHY